MWHTNDKKSVGRNSPADYEGKRFSEVSYSTGKLGKLPPYVLRFLRRMTDPKPERRFATPDEALHFLDEWKAQEERKFRIFLTATAVLSSLLIATILVIGIGWIRRPSSVSVSAASEAPSGPRSEPEAEDSEFSIPESVK